MMGFGMGGAAMGWVMIVITLVTIGLGVLLLAALFPRASRNSPMNGLSQRVESLASPLEILKQRYARGEITKEQFEQMRRDVEA
jgi:putative membrane protein